ncbi:dynamin family protein [Campylobacter ureolyticus]|uniref:dynamin family protein n=2 Tax=Campylobacter ureolyticus TaxID=827 RepID=UPI0022B318CD|nr:dynamin family protein [Campylobacter ureolyticus]MCZ6174512.1 dynamin family protein [Campylobacter ureolyticus]
MHDDLSLKYTLISKLLSAKLENEGVCKFKEIFEKEFLEFANSDDALPNEAEIVLKLQSIEKELSIIASCPELYKKNIIAVGGGFSAGKSAFINSFLYSTIKLDTNIDPTTALPTYVINSNSEAILGYSKNGGVVNLKEIDENFHTKFSHQFLNSFGFNIKEIMPFMVISTKMKFENICFIDTPGYNPPNINDKYDEDIKISKEFLEEANVFIWLINSENGTIQNSDLDFLTSLNLDNKKLFVLVNKADLRSNDDLKDIINEVKESLDDYDIKYEGIQTYASQNNQNHTPIVIKKSLDEFLKENDTISKKHLNILNKLKEIYQIYKNAINEKINRKKEIKDRLNTLSINMLELNIEESAASIYNGINELKDEIDFQKEKNNLKKIKNVVNNFKIATEIVFDIDSVNINFDDDMDRIKEIKKDISDYKNKFFGFTKKLKIYGNKYKQKLEENLEVASNQLRNWEYNTILDDFKKFVKNASKEDELDINTDDIIDDILNNKNLKIYMNDSELNEYIIKLFIKFDKEKRNKYTKNSFDKFYSNFKNKLRF